MSSKLQIKLFLLWMVSVYTLAASTTAQAAEMALARSPLFLGTQISPNIFFMLDDSGSMDWETLTVDYQYYENYWSSSTNRAVVDDGTFLGFASSGDCTGRDLYYYIFEYSTNRDNVYSSRCELEGSPEVAVRDWRIRNSNLNIMYYNPAATYQPWRTFSVREVTLSREAPATTKRTALKALPTMFGSTISAMTMMTMDRTVGLVDRIVSWMVPMATSTSGTAI